MKTAEATYWRMLSLARPYWGRLVLAVLCAGMVTALETLSMYLVKVVMDEGFLNTDKAQALRMLKLLPLGIIATLVLKGAFSYLADVLNNGVSNRLGAELRERIFGKLLELPVSYHSHQRLGTLTSRLTYDATVMQSGISEVVGRVISSSLRILGLSGLVFWLNWKLALQVLVVFPLAMGPLLWFGRKIRKYSWRDQERMADLASLAAEVLSGIRVVLSFAREAMERRRFGQAAQAHYDAVMRKLRVAALSSPVMETIGGVGFALMIFLAGMHVVEGAMTMGGFLALVGAVASLYPQVKNLNGVNVSIQNAVAAGQRVFEVLDQRPAVADRPGAREAGPLRREIRFEGVRFAYERHEVLRGLDLSLRAGRRVALVGPSGAGKTTLADLVPRFHDPSGGRVLWDGTDLRDLRLDSLRRQVGVVTQETFLFNDTIAANIAYGRPEASRDEIVAAARAANADEFIRAQPQGYDTLIGERGVRLSGGQRQRLAIARALLKNPPVLILDEATSALDAQSERAVQEALERLMKGRTTLVIAHRLSTVRHADEIVVLDKGRVVERGRHAALLKQGGLYARLYKMQFGRLRRFEAGRAGRGE